MKGSGAEFRSRALIAQQPCVQGADVHLRTAGGDARGVADGNVQAQFCQLSGNAGSGDAGAKHIDLAGWWQRRILFENTFTRQTGAFERSLIHLGHGKTQFSQVAADLARGSESGYRRTATTQARNVAQHWAAT